jgi:hypothetical protein
MEDAFKVGDLVQRRLGYAPSEYDDQVGLVVEIEGLADGGSWIGVVWSHKPGIMLWNDSRDIRGVSE